MKLIVGLGNPGDKYANTRHNAGFMALDHFLQAGDGDYKFEKKFNALITERDDAGDKFLFIKPQTFMNDSGKTIGALAQFYKVEPKDILVIYDELDLPFGTIRTRLGGSTAGHNGVESIVQNIGHDFWRIRIGIQNEQRATWDTSDFVLAPFKQEEVKALPAILQIAQEYIEQFITSGQLNVETSKGDG